MVLAWGAACVLFAVVAARPAAAVAGCAPPGKPVIAEVLYDAAGVDTGNEFVELYNPGAVAVSLEGLRLESGDGSGADRWTLRWTAADEDTLSAGARWVIGGANVHPAPDAVVSLNLQNGPDAVRLVWPDGATETLGYGDHELAEYACGAPAPDVPSGFSLARIPDDSNLGSNVLDFRAAAPSPGRANLPVRDVRMERGSLALDPERPVPGESARLSGIVSNGGRDDVSAGALHVRVSAESLLADVPVVHALAAGESLAFEIEVPGLPAGKHVLAVRAVLAGDDAPENDADSLRVRAGAGPLEITEIQFHPANDEGEWVEVVNRSVAPLDPSAFRLSDRGGAQGLPRDGTAHVPPGSLAVLAQRRVDLIARHPGIDAARVWQVSPWAALNNSDGADGTADVVVLREDDGTLSDRVPYSGRGVPDGVPLERRDGGWWPALAENGTPLAPPLVLPAVAGSFDVVPRRLRSAAATATVVWDLAWPRARATLELYDLAGRRVARPFADVPVPARGEKRWSAAGLAPGVYVAVLHVRPEGSGEVVTATRPLRIEAP